MSKVRQFCIIEMVIYQKKTYQTHAFILVLSLILDRQVINVAREFNPNK